MADGLEREALASRVAIAVNEARSMSVFCSVHPLAAIRPLLTAAGVITARELRRTPSGRRVRVTGLQVIVHMPPTKSGKRVIFVTLEDETGLVDVTVFPKAQIRSAQAVLSSEVQTVEGRLQRDGRNGLAISIVLDRTVPHLTGSLFDILALANQTDSNRTGCETSRVKVRENTETR